MNLTTTNMLNRLGKFLLSHDYLQPIHRPMRKLAELYLQAWSSQNSDFHRSSLPEGGIKGFEDLWWLFHVGPSNRGIIRLDFDEARLLYKYCRTIREGHVLEIGRFNGGSTLLIACGIGLSAHLTSIDRSPKNDDELLNVLCKFNCDEKVTLVNADANTVNSQEKYRLIFIDGDHTYEGIKNDFNKWKTQLEKNAYIVFHDAAQTRWNSTTLKDCSRFVKEILQNWAVDYKLIDQAGSLAIVQFIGNRNG